MTLFGPTLLLARYAQKNQNSKVKPLDNGLWEITLREDLQDSRELSFYYIGYSLNQTGKQNGYVHIQIDPRQGRFDQVGFNAFEMDFSGVPDNFSIYFGRYNSEDITSDTEPVYYNDKKVTLRKPGFVTTPKTVSRNFIEVYQDLVRHSVLPQLRGSVEGLL